MNRLSMSRCVVWLKPPVAPRLAPQDLVTFANVRMSENSVDHALLQDAVLREAGHAANPAAMKQPRGGAHIMSSCL